MNLGQLIAKFRQRVDDATGPKYLWDAPSVIDFANQAEREACERAKLLEDDADAVSVTVTLTQSGGIATATATAHPFSSGQKLVISGATPAGYNVEAPITKTGANSFTFPVASASLTSPATGSITASLISGVICNIAGLENVASYDLHRKILEVRGVTWDGVFLDGVSRASLNAQHRRGWKTKVGDPTHFIDPQEHYLTLYRVPPRAADIHLSVLRLPLTDMALDADVPEIHERHHYGLIDFMEHLAFSVDDTEVKDDVRAAKAEAKFTSRFGPRIDAEVRRNQRDREPNHVVMNPGW